jgi:hypothetical protein
MTSSAALEVAVALDAYQGARRMLVDASPRAL